jgi:cytidyltransferase-like protein
MQPSGNRPTNAAPTVAVWGVFDLLHLGHFLFLQNASSYGELHVILMPDEIARENKGAIPLFSAAVRERHLYSLGFVKKVHHDCLAYGLKSLFEIAPSVFCTGYNQSSRWEEQVRELLIEMDLITQFIRLPSYADGISSSEIKRRIIEQMMQVGDSTHD